MESGQQQQQLLSTIDESIFNLGCEEFYIAIASNPGLLQKGYEIVYKFLSLSQGNREQTLLHLLSPKAPVLTLVTRTYPIVYADETVCLSEQERRKTKQFLILQILLKQLLSAPTTSKKQLTNFLLFLIHFHNNEGFSGWVQYYQTLLQEMIRINSPLIGFVLITILKNSDDRVSLFSRHILQFIITNQEMLKITEQQSLEITYYCIKSMAYMNGTEDDVLQRFYQPYEQQILGYIAVSMSKSVRIMKYSLKILTVMVGDYEVELEKDLVERLKQCAGQLVGEFVLERAVQREKDDLDDEDDQQQQLQQQGEKLSTSASIAIILYQLIELFQTLLSTQQLKLSDYPLYLSICLPSLLLGKCDYLSYCESTQGYLADVEDEGEKTLRNKVVSFFVQLIEGQYPEKTKMKLLNQLVKYTMLVHKYGVVSQEVIGQELVNFYSGLSFKINLQKQHLPLFQQSILFLLYHLTQEVLTFDTKNLQQNKQSLMQSLGQRMESPTNDPLIKVACVNLLNKLIKSMAKGYKQAYYQFMIKCLNSVADYDQQKGFVLGLCRGIAYVSNDAVINLAGQSSVQTGCVPHVLLQSLMKYLLDQNTLQQSAHLILEFLLILLKKGNNSVVVLKQIITPQIQMYILSTFIHDGMIADVVIDLLAQVGHEELITFVYGEFLKGLAKDQNLSALISKWVKLGKVNITQTDTLMLLKNYNSQFISKIIKQHLKLIKTTGKQLPQQIIQLMNENIHPSWVLIMLGANILQNPEVLLLRTVEKITNELTSQYEIEGQLLLPYYTLVNDPVFGVNIVRAKSLELYEAFINKLIRYAALFQGPNLKVITCIVLLNIAELDPSKLPSILELISSYGNTMPNEEWQDENEKDEQTIMDRMFNMKITNDDVQTDFAEVFGGKVYDMGYVNEKVNILTGKK